MALDYSFKPGLAASVATAVLVPLFLELGSWQIRRAEEKEALLARQSDRAGLPELAIDRGSYPLDDIRYRAVVVVGTYDANHQYILDNQVHHGEAGYHVLTPLRLKGDRGLAILVNRGWVSAGGDRSVLPKLDVPGGERMVRGTVDRFPSVALRLPGAETPSPGWPSRILIADPAVLSEHLGYALLPYQVSLSPSEPHGYVREWRPASSDPGRNRGYALQWYSFAAAVIALFLWHGSARRQRPPPEAHGS